MRVFLLCVMLVGCAGIQKPQTTEEWIEVLELSARQAQTSIVRVTCLTFEAGRCTDPNALLDPDEAIALHDKLALARTGLRASASISGIGDCMGQMRTVDECLADVSRLITSVQAQVK